MRGVFFFAARVCGAVCRALFFAAGMHAACFFCCGLGARFIFCCGCAARLCVCCGCAARFSLCCRRAARFFLLRVRGEFFFFGCVVRFSLCCRCAACFLFLRVCGAVCFLLPVPGAGHAWRLDAEAGGCVFSSGRGGDMMGLRRRVHVFAAGARRVCLFFCCGCGGVSCAEQRRRTFIYMVALKKMVWAGHGWAWQ